MSAGVNAAEEISQLRQQAAVESFKTEEAHKVEEKPEETVRQSYQEEIYENYEQIQSSREQNIQKVVLYAFNLFAYVFFNLMWQRKENIILLLKQTNYYIYTFT